MQPLFITDKYSVSLHKSIIIIIIITVVIIVVVGGGGVGGGGTVWILVRCFIFSFSNTFLNHFGNFQKPL
jgi:flagellar basal body-associated protein FliL